MITCAEVQSSETGEPLQGFYEPLGSGSLLVGLSFLVGPVPPPGLVWVHAGVRLALVQKEVRDSYSMLLESEAIAMSNQTC